MENTKYSLIDSNRLKRVCDYSFINNYGFLFWVSGFHKSNDFDFYSDSILFKKILIQFIKNDINHSTYNWNNKLPNKQK